VLPTRTISGGRHQEQGRLDILRRFIAVNELHLSKTFASRIAPALQTLGGERVTEVLHSLQNIFLEGTPISGGIQHFFALFVTHRARPANARWGKSYRLQSGSERLSTSQTIKHIRAFCPDMITVSFPSLRPTHSLVFEIRFC
jgi:hypothetical protein